MTGAGWRGLLGTSVLCVWMVGCFDPFPREPQVSLERSLCTYYSSCALPAFVLLFGEQEDCEEALVTGSRFLLSCEYDAPQGEACRQQIDLSVGACDDITQGECEAVLACPDERCERGYDRLIECGLADGPFSPKFCLGFSPDCALDCLVDAPADCKTLVSNWVVCADNCDRPE